MSAINKKFATQSFLDQVDDEDVLAAILKLRRHGKQPELLPAKDKTPVLHRLLDHSVKLVDEQRPLENKTAVKNQYMDELDDDDVFAALQAMQRKMPPHMRTLYREIDLNHQRREDAQLILPPSMRKQPIASEGEDGKVDDSLDEMPREETEETATEAVAGVSLQFDGAYEWNVVSVAKRAEKHEAEAQDSSYGQDHRNEKPKRRGFFKKIMSVGNPTSAATSDHIEPETNCELADNGNDADNHLSVQVQEHQIEKPKRRGLLRKMLSVGNLAHTASDESEGASWQVEETREMVEMRSEPGLPDEDHAIGKPTRLGLLRRSRSSGNLVTAVQESSSWQVESVQQSEESREAALSAYVQNVILPRKGRHRFRKPKLRSVLKGIRVAASRANPFVPGDSDEEDDSSQVEDEELSREVLETKMEFDARSAASLVDQDHDFEKSKGHGLLKRFMKASRSRANSFVSDENCQEEDLSQVEGKRQREMPEMDFDARSAASLVDQDYDFGKLNRRGLLKKMLSSASLASFVGPAQNDSPFQVEQDFRREEQKSTLSGYTQNSALSPGESNRMKKSKQNGLVKRVKSTGDLASVWAQDQHDPQQRSYPLDEDQRRVAHEAVLSDCGVSSPYESHRIKTQKRRWLVNSAKSMDAAESTEFPKESDLDPVLRCFDNQDAQTQAHRRNPRHPRHPRHMEQLRSCWRSARKEPATEVEDDESQRVGVLVEERSLESQPLIPSFDEKHHKSPGHERRLKKLLQIRRKESSEESADFAVHLPAFLPHQYTVETHSDPSPNADSVILSQRSSSLNSEIRQKGALEDYDNVSYRDESGYIERKNARRRARLAEREFKYPHSVHPPSNVTCSAATSDDMESKVLRATDLVCGDGNTVKSIARTDGFTAKSNRRERSHSLFGGRGACQGDPIPYTCTVSSIGERASDHKDGQVFDRILDYFEEKIGCQNDELYIEGEGDESFADSSYAYSRTESSLIYTRKTSLSTEASTVENEGTIAI
jgi:hypothetical protein